MAIDANTPLNARQETFVDEYLVDLNATRAAIAAGYSKKTATVIASENLSKPNIAAAIQKERRLRAKSLEVTKDRIIAEYAKLAFSNIDDYIDTTGDLPVIDMVGLTRDELAAVSEITVDTRKEFEGYGQDREHVADVDKVKFKLYSKKDALDALGRHLGLFEKDNKQTAPTIVINGRAADL